MNYSKRFLVSAASTLFACAFTGSVMAQAEFSAGTDNGIPGSTAEVSLDWVEDGTVANITVWIDFDPSVISPEVTGGNNTVVGCLSGLPDSHTGILTTCVNPAATPGRIVVVISDQSGTSTTLPSTNVGSITFNIDGGATVPSDTPVTVDVQEASGDSLIALPDGHVTETNGAVEIISTPPEELSELTVTPASIDFGLVDLGGMPVTETITATNTGGASSTLNISDASFSGDAVFTIATNGCAGTDLAAGESCDVVVEFNAVADGVYTGSVDFTSDADSNPNALVSVTGEAGSAPDLSVTPAPGSINLGTGLQGTVLTSGGSFSNAGSAAGDVDCTVSGAEFSTVPSPIAGTIEPGGSLDFSVQCTLPADAEDGDTFGGVLACSGDIDVSWELSCGVSEWEPLPVPTMQKWGLIVLTLMMLMVGGLSIRFFRN